MEKNFASDNKRIINFEGAYNARDMGGFRTAGGGTVKSGLLFRSDELSGLTENDLARLDTLGIRTFVDFRSRKEIERSRNKLPRSARALELSIDGGDLNAVLDSVDENSGPKIMERVNRSLVRKSGEVYREFFSLLARRGNIPLLFHCTAGKDRTGFAAAMFLSSLGVSREDIFRDYMLSAIGAEKKFGALIEAAPRYASIVTARPNYLAAALDEIDASFGSVEKYLTEGLGVNLNEMRDIFVAGE